MAWEVVPSSSLKKKRRKKRVRENLKTLISCRRRHLLRRLPSATTLAAHHLYRVVRQAEPLLRPSFCQAASVSVVSRRSLAHLHGLSLGIISKRAPSVRQAAFLRSPSREHLYPRRRLPLRAARATGSQRVPQSSEPSSAAHELTRAVLASSRAEPPLTQPFEPPNLFLVSFVWVLVVSQQRSILDLK